ncbi:MAG: TnpV protein [Oscillospiraceae bacterium]|nr:TnpV protein [Oscillospiraceae bacterium]
MEKSLFEQIGGTYIQIGDYQIPNLALPDEPEHHIGIWGQRRLDYLKKHKRGLYTDLLTSGKLNAHLHEIDIAAFERHDLIVKQMMATQGITEQLKADDMMKWVGMVNNIRNCADEIIRNELIYR